MNGKRIGLLFAFATSVACGDSDDTGGGAAKQQKDFYKSSDCEACDVASCPDAHAACKADAACAVYLTCLGQCELGPNGDADSACEVACAGQASATDLVETFRTCRTDGPGSLCVAECGRTPADGGGGAGGEAPTCGGDWSFPQMCAPMPNIDDECMRCNYEKCCDAADALSDPGPAQELTDCWLACTTPACEADCFDMYPDGIPGFAEWEACFFSQCGEPVGPCELTGTCNQCWYDECECEYLDCKNDPECYLTFACYGECSTTQCVDACVAEHPNGATAFNTLQTCILQRCGDQCGTGG